MHSKSFSYLKIKKEYLKFLKSQEVRTEPFRDKLGQLNNFYFRLMTFIKQSIKENLCQKKLARYF